MNTIQEIISQYESASLEDLVNVTALNRQDTKFIFNSNRLPELLHLLINNYFILEIAPHRIFNYNNLYYDTSDFKLYLQHHNGCRPRYKVRCREYPESSLSYFEIKTKTNKNRTQKSRIKLPSGIDYVRQTGPGTDIFSDKTIISMINSDTRLAANELFPRIGISFTRMTLVEKEFCERITIDNNLYCAIDSVNHTFNNVTIAEVKQNRYNPQSILIRTMRWMSVHETRFSKYCMGINYCYTIKYNRFKPRIRELNRIMAAG